MGSHSAISRPEHGLLLFQRGIHGHVGTRGIVSYLRQGALPIGVETITRLRKSGRRSGLMLARMQSGAKSTKTIAIDRRRPERQRAHQSCPRERRHSSDVSWRGLSLRLRVRTSKQLHGHRYARFRGLLAVTCQCLLAAAAQNIKKIALALAPRPSLA